MPSMQLQTRIIDHIAVVELHGRFVGSDVILRQCLFDLERDGHTRVLIDLAQVDYMDSSGLGELIAGYVAARDAGGSLKLMRLPKRVQLLLEVTNLIAIFETFGDEAAALASFSDHAPAVAMAGAVDRT